MMGLLYKELILNKKILLTIGLGIIFVSIYVFFPVKDSFDGAESVYTLLMGAITVVIFVMTGIIHSNIFVCDERKKWANFISSTPMLAKGQVFSKYCFALLLSMATLAYCALILGINALIQGKSCGAFNIAFFAFIIQIFMRSIELPFIIRFGSKFGNNYRMVIIGIIIFIIFVYYLFGDLSIFGSPQKFINSILIFLNDRDDSIQIISVSALVISTVMYCLSYKISCILYLKGTECYDR